MDSSWALRCSTALVLVFLSSASKDEAMLEQREVTFDLDKLIQGQQQPESFMLQKEVDLADILDPKEFPMQQMIVDPPELLMRGGSASGVLTPRGSRPRFGPRSFGNLEKYPVQFPLSRPTSDNIQAICLHGDHRPRYPRSYFPNSGFGQQRRRAAAVNNAEAWFSTCCKENQTSETDVMLCCATQAWELSVELFCEEDGSVKDRLYHCCKRRGNDRLSCFNDDASNPNYEPTEVLPVPSLPSAADFIFEPNNCQRKLMAQYSPRASGRMMMGKQFTSKKPDINFPPGRPTADNIESLCSNQKLRPLYNIKCLPRYGYDELARQAKTINRLEKGFKQCCKKRQGVLNCAGQKWHQELHKFCVAMNSEQVLVDSHCCFSRERENDVYSCFQTASPDPHYNMTSATEEPSLDKICDTHNIIKKRLPVGFPLKTFVSQCCPLSEQDKTSCLVQKLDEISQNLCSSEKTSSPAVRRCCEMTSQEEISQCVSTIVMDASAKAAKKMRKRCPIS